MCLRRFETVPCLMLVCPQVKSIAIVMVIDHLGNTGRVLLNLLVHDVTDGNIFFLIFFLLFTLASSGELVSCLLSFFRMG